MQCFERQMMLIYVHNMLRNCGVDVARYPDLPNEIVERTAMDNITDLQRVDCERICALAGIVLKTTNPRAA